MIDKYETISDDVIELYVPVARDYHNRHAPDVQAVAIAKIKFQGKSVESVRFANREEVSVSDENWEHLKGILSIERFFNVISKLIEAKYVLLSTE